MEYFESGFKELSFRYGRKRKQKTKNKITKNSFCHNSILFNSFWLFCITFICMFEFSCFHLSDYNLSFIIQVIKRYLIRYKKRYKPSVFLQSNRTMGQSFSQVMHSSARRGRILLSALQVRFIFILNSLSLSLFFSFSESTVASHLTTVFELFIHSFMWLFVLCCRISRCKKRLHKNVFSSRWHSIRTSLLMIFLQTRPKFLFPRTDQWWDYFFVVLSHSLHYHYLGFHFVEIWSVLTMIYLFVWFMFCGVMFANDRVSPMHISIMISFQSMYSNVSQPMILKLYSQILHSWLFHWFPWNISCSSPWFLAFVLTSNRLSLSLQFTIEFFIIGCFQ